MDLIGIDDWALSDEQLIERLLSCPDTKKLIGLNYLGKLPGLACMATFRGTLEDAGFATRQQLHTAVRDEVHRQTGDNSIIVYVFVDRGALERRIEFVDPEDDTQWAVGHTSATLFLYLLKRSGTAHQEALLRILASTLNGWTIHATTASACADRVDDQPTLDFEIRTG